MALQARQNVCRLGDRLLRHECSAPSPSAHWPPGLRSSRRSWFGRSPRSSGG